MLDKISTSLRFFLLQIMLIAGLVALYVDGYLMKIFGGDAKWFVGIVVGLALVGLFKVFRQRWMDAYWYANVLMRIGVLGMIVGCSGGLTALAAAIASGAEPGKVLGVFLGGMGIAFYVSLSAIAANIWIEANMQWLGGNREEA